MADVRRTGAVVDHVRRECGERGADGLAVEKVNRLPGDTSDVTGSRASGPVPGGHPHVIVREQIDQMAAGEATAATSLPKSCAGCSSGRDAHHGCAPGSPEIGSRLASVFKSSCRVLAIVGSPLT